MGLGSRVVGVVGSRCGRGLGVVGIKELWGLKGWW